MRQPAKRVQHRLDDDPQFDILHPKHGKDDGQDEEELRDLVAGSLEVAARIFYF